MHMGDSTLDYGMMAHTCYTTLGNTVSSLDRDCGAQSCTMVFHSMRTLAKWASMVATPGASLNLLSWLT